MTVAHFQNELAKNQLQAKSYQKSKTVVEPEIYDNFTLLHVLSKTGTAQTQPCIRETTIGTTTAGGLWGAYLMTVAHFQKEAAS